MSATDAQTSTGSSVVHGRNGRRWIGLIFGLIGLNMGIVATTVYFAASDRSSGVEPNYYAQALKYDQVILQRAANKRLGWSSVPTLTASPDGQSATLLVRLLDADSKPISAALLRAVAFPNLRSGERSSVALRESPDGYVASVPLSAAGQWRIRLTATRGSETFTSEQDVMLITEIASAPGSRTGESR